MIPSALSAGIQSGRPRPVCHLASLASLASPKVERQVCLHSDREQLVPRQLVSTQPLVTGPSTPAKRGAFSPGVQRPQLFHVFPTVELPRSFWVYPCLDLPVPVGNSVNFEVRLGRPRPAEN